MQTPVEIIGLVALLAVSSLCTTAAQAQEIQNRVVLHMSIKEADKLTEYENQLRRERKIPDNDPKVSFYFAGPPRDREIEETLSPRNEAIMGEVVALDFSKQRHSDIEKMKIIGLAATLKESKFVADAVREACKKAYLEALYNLRRDVRVSKGNAAIYIESILFSNGRKYFKSHDQFLCDVTKESISGNIFSTNDDEQGVSTTVHLRGSIVRLK